MTAAVMPAVMTGRARRIDEPTPRFRVEIRACVAGRELVTRSFAYFDLAAAERDFNNQRRLNRRMFASGRYRLVLIDTEGQR